MGRWTARSSPAHAAAVVRRAVEQRATVVFGNADPERAASLGLRPAHAYAVLGLEPAPEGRPTLRLRNPTGEVSPRAREIPGVPGGMLLELDEAVRVFRWVGVVGPDLSALRALSKAGRTSH